MGIDHTSGQFAEFRKEMAVKMMESHVQRPLESELGGRCNGKSMAGEKENIFLQASNESPTNGGYISPGWVPLEAFVQFEKLPLPCGIIGS